MDFTGNKNSLDSCADYHQNESSAPRCIQLVLIFSIVTAERCLFSKTCCTDQNRQTSGWVLFLSFPRTFSHAH